MLLGLDLDNTLIRYDRLFESLASELGLAPDNTRGKTAVRDTVRASHGDESWQHLQALAYGKRIAEAELFPQVAETLATLKAAGHKLIIISHKSRYTSLYGAAGPDLHAAARRFLKQCGLDRLVDEVLFCPTREEKCLAIARAACDAFVDDLPEVFEHASFPKICRKILFGDMPADCALRFWPALPLLIAKYPLQAKQLDGGRNSTVYQSGDMVIKRYPQDGRNRCQAEWKALIWLRANGFNNVSPPLACDPQNELAVLGYIEGFQPASDDAALAQMTDFALALHTRKTDAQFFPPAAEACFSRQEIQEQLYARLNRLLAVPANDNEQRDMLDFVSGELQPAIQDALRHCPDFGTLPLHCRMLSPSDFGLHNALQNADGKLTFLDFEYFGQDDPVKLVCDFLLHPGMTLGREQRLLFAETLLAACEKSDDRLIQKRCAAFLPLWRLKWCCILLNPYLANGNERPLLRTRLAKAKAMLYGAPHVLS